MNKELFKLPEKIKQLREQLGMTQAELAKALQLTRSSVNGWEMGLSMPSTSMVVELAKVFNVSTDYLLGLDKYAALDISGLSEKEVAILCDLVQCFKSN